jgi:hypothetical protein
MHLCQYREHVITDSNVYLAPDQRSFRIGNKKQAAEEGWVSMEEGRKLYEKEEDFVNAVSNITMFNKKELQTYSCRQKEMWEVFEGKISNFFIIVFTLHLFKKYTKHTLLKYIRNGYDRV